ncbi:MAG: MATE family efflux transporter [Pseudohongiellaceae bacterium]|jgi:MATE family multidrug resistance protein
MLFDRLHFNRQTLRELLVIALPMVISQGTFAVMIFTDRYFMSQIDATHMAAALGGGVAAFFSFCFFSGLFSYANAMSAQYLGAGSPDKCSRVVTQGWILTAACSPLLVAITVLVADIFAAMGHDPAQVELERGYFLLLMMGSVVTLAKVCISSYFAGIGRTRVVMICDLFALLINIPLCYVMVFGHLGLPALGITGAGLSTIIATLAGLLLFLGFYFHRSHREHFQVLQSFRFDAGIMRRFLRLGLPSGIEMFLNVAAFNLFLLMFQSYGVNQGAAAAIVFNWDMLSYIPMVGLNLGVLSMIGRFVGGNDLERANEVITSGFIVGLVYSAVLAGLFVTLRYPLVDIFTPPVGDFREIRELAAYMMIGLASYAMADAIIQVCGGVLRGAGDTRWVMWASVSLHWIMLVLQYLIILVLDYGPRVSWLAFVAMILAIAVVFVVRLRSGVWRDPERLRLVMAE